MSIIRVDSSSSVASSLSTDPELTLNEIHSLSGIKAKEYYCGHERQSPQIAVGHTINCFVKRSVDIRGITINRTLVVMVIKMEASD